MNNHPSIESVMSGLLKLPMSSAERAVTPEQIVTKSFEEYKQSLYQYLLMILMSPAESEDISQEAFLRLHRNLLDGKNIENHKAWLFRVGRNLALDRLRGMRPVDSLSEEEILIRAEHKTAGAISDPEQLFLNQEGLRRVAQVISRLPERQRECLHLKAEGFRYHEIASMLGIGRSSVIEHVRRAVTRLTEELQSYA